MKKSVTLVLIGAFLGILLLPYVVFRQPEMPEGTDLRSPDFPYSQADLLIDRTAWDADRQARALSHKIFEAMLDEIAAAETYLILDFFLWNPWTGALTNDEPMPDLSTRLADALIAKHRAEPNLPILLITDPINRIYSDHAPEFYDRLALENIPVVFTDLNQLPDSNLLYAPQARFWNRLLGDNAASGDAAEVKGRFANPFDQDGRRLSAGAMARLLFFKANHRKVLVSGRTDGQSRLVIGSLNPADGSGFHSNLAVRVTGAVADFAAASELQIAEWSLRGLQPTHVLEPDVALQAILDIRERLQVALTRPPETIHAGESTVTWVSEGQVREAIIEILQRAGPGAQIDCGIFYYSDRKIIKAMKAAIERGVEFRILMDSNRDAFGREKSGIPNRQVAAELMSMAGEGRVEVRWAKTHGEQFHSKVLRYNSAEEDVLLLGSANWTRRNVGNLNLEANVLFQNAGELGAHFDQYFTAIWTNESGYEESQPFDAWAESGWTLRWKTWLYRFQEWSGASTF